ncbi:collagen alpha-1(III) chain-like [Ovis aries]|uniref:collagen alpha-1(III) chain-like n=1 Tax=Ovis aries TaxID=9940 RepID=UPI001C2EBBDD|nr:collagen alpha-1(III) chain-like [Ovis aries]
MGGGGAGPRTLGSERHYFGENFSRTLGWEGPLAKGRAWMAGGRWKGGKAAAGKILGGRRGVQGCDTCGLGLETEAAGGGGCECRGGVRVGGGGAVLHVGGPFPGAAGRDLGAVRRGAKPDFLPGPSAPPPSGVPRRAAQGRSQRPPYLAVFSLSSHSAHLPGARVLLLLVTSVRGAGDQVEADFPAGRRPDRRNLRRSHPAASHPPRPGRDARERREGGPLSARFPQSPRGPRVGGCLTFHCSPSSDPAGVCSEPGSVCLRGDSGLCAPRGPPPPSVPGWIASSCGFPNPGLGIFTPRGARNLEGKQDIPPTTPKGTVSTFLASLFTVDEIPGPGGDRQPNACCSQRGSRTFLREKVNLIWRMTPPSWRW